MFEDGGSDFTPLEVDEAQKSVLACSFNTFADCLELSFGQVARQEVEVERETQIAQLVGESFALHYFHGREMCELTVYLTVPLTLAVKFCVHTKSTAMIRKRVSRFVRNVCRRRRGNQSCHQTSLAVWQLRGSSIWNRFIRSS